MMRIGIGEDLHRFVSGRKLILGGIEIPSEKGLLGHSDADALLHAISDALLGALALEDIGAYFPPKDPKCEGIDSKEILRFCLNKVREKGYGVVNVDAVITTESPKLRPYIASMRESVSAILGIAKDCVGLQAKTNEGCDAIGAGEALHVSAVCLLEKKEEN